MPVMERGCSGTPNLQLQTIVKINIFLIILAQPTCQGIL